MKCAAGDRDRARRDLARPGPRSRAGNALMLILGISILLGIQVYVIHKYTTTSFRHTERVNAHMRAIYVGESAFSRIQMRLKAGKWEERWFKGTPSFESNIALEGGTYSSYVGDATPVTPSTEKLVDVWIESRYDGSLSVMYYRVLYADDTLDFTAQVYPKFFTFIEENKPNPFTGAVGPAVTFAKDQIKAQQDNEAAAVAALNGVRSSCDLAGIGSTLGIAYPGPPLDVVTLAGGGPVNLCSVVNDVASSLNALPLPPLPLPLPPPDPPPPPASRDFTAVISTAFAAQVPPLALPTTGTCSVKVSNQPAGPLYFVDPKDIDNDWCQAALNHHSRGMGHIIDKHVPAVLANMLAKMETTTSAADAQSIRNVADQVMALCASEVTRIGGAAAPTVKAAPTTAQDYMDNFDAYKAWLYANGGADYASKTK